MKKIEARHSECLATLATAGVDDDIRTNCIGIIGCLGTRPHSLQQNMAIASLFLDRLQHDDSLGVLAETLNAVFDVYSEENYDEVIAKLDMIMVLKKFSVKLASMIQLQQRNRTVDKALLEHIKEAKINLNRFIKYKLKEKN